MSRCLDSFFSLLLDFLLLNRLFFNLLLLFQVYGYPMIQIFNSDTMAIELIQSISGSVGILLTVPLVSLFAALLLTRSFPKKSIQPSK